MPATNKRATKAFVTTREAAEMLNLSTRTVQLWTEGGILSCWKTEGGHRRITRESVERLIVGAQLQERASEREVRVPSGTTSLRAQSLKVLVVEDEPTLLRLYRLQLAKWRLQPEVTTARNGFEALVKLGGLRPDLLITDLNMPEMDGFQMLRSLRAMPEMDAMEMVVVTGLDPDEIAQEGGIPDGIPVLFKPIQFPELEKIAEHVVAEQRQRGIRQMHEIRSPSET